MTDYTLSTGISRRSMLLGSILAPSLAPPLLAAHAALPERLTRKSLKENNTLRGGEM